MNEENKGTPKNKWSRIFRKKWFFPALYLTIAALLLSAVVWYQNLENQVPDATDIQNEQDSDNYQPTPNEDEAEPVLEQQEVIKMPVADQEQAEIVTKFFDYNAEQEDRENALILHNNRFYQSTGVDIASADAETFNVVASLSGTVTEVKEDPLLGNVVIMSHENDVTTYYASLENVVVTAGDEVKQGDEIGTAGKNIFGKDNGTHVHFELRKDGKEVNPESFFNQSVSSLNDPVTEEAAESPEAVEDPEATESPEADEDQEATDETDEPIDSEEKPEEDSAEDPAADDDVEDENTDEESDDSANTSGA
ncbi:M23 family metallopeptidase [Oceanobacillus chungangensis]|uniref:Stage II sporulation protein n=1 Tax=Oceanobacillus chungangensis TaxID=1229152 RepID=A0A3D8PX05_9BACI|nr:M23 family metallopeptidase [Oceanobacillus chungangensis]RDW20564.1 stage II sporulation protein [Oceanobacillus chungangensis]